MTLLIFYNDNKHFQYSTDKDHSSYIKEEKIHGLHRLEK